MAQTRENRFDEDRHIGSLMGKKVYLRHLNEPYRTWVILAQEIASNAVPVDRNKDARKDMKRRTRQKSSDRALRRVQGDVERALNMAASDAGVEAQSDHDARHAAHQDAARCRDEFMNETSEVIGIMKRILRCDNRFWR